MRSNASGVKEVKTAGSKSSLALLIFVVGCITLPFIYKAFHLDDTIFIRLAEEKLKDPLSLGLYNHGFGGDFYELYMDTHPPLMTSYIALLLWMFGGASEAVLHAGFIFFPALASFSMFYLARRFTDRPLAAALLLLVTPGFMVMSQSIMTDIPALSFWLAAIAAYVYGVDREDRKLLVLTTVFLTLAVLTTYQSLSLVPLLLLYAFLKRRVSLRNMLPLVATLVVFVAIFIFFILKTGGPPRLSYSIGLNLAPSFIANKMLSSISVIGGAIVFPVFLVTGMLKGKKEYLAFAAFFGLLFLVFMAKVSSDQYTLVTASLQVVFYSAGILAAYRFIQAGTEAALSRAWARDDGDTVFLFLWIFGVLTYCILLLPYASTRYLLTLFPPVVLLFTRYARTVFTAERQWNRFAVAAIACTAIVGLATSIADYQLSGIYRDFASTYPQKLRTEKNNIWFAGEFGLRYYLEENGGQYLTRQDNSPAAGDRVILSHDLIAYYLSDDLKSRLTFEQKVTYPVGWPVRVEDRGSQAGFYDQFHGYLPYSISSEPVETIDIYRVKDRAEVRSQE